MNAKPHIYLFFGEDTFSIAEKALLWKDEFRKKYGPHTSIAVDLESLAEEESKQNLNRLLVASTLFSSTKLIVLKNAFSKNCKKLVLEALSEILPAVPANHFVVVTAQSVDARTVLSKRLKELEKEGRAKAEEFTIPKGPALRTWIEQRLKKSGARADARTLSLIQARFQPEFAPSYQQGAPTTLWQIHQELLKLAAYAGKRPIGPNDVALLIPLRNDAHLFELVSALLSGSEEKARLLVKGILDEEGGDLKPAVLGMTAQLTGQFRDLLRVRLLKDSGVGDGEIASELGWKPNRVWVVGKKVERLSAPALARVYTNLIQQDWKLKSTSLHPGALFELFIHTATRTLSGK